MAQAGEPPQVVFANGPAEIRTILNNSTEGAVEHSVLARVAMLASSIAAPLTEIRRPEPVKIPAGESALVTWRVDVPAVRTPTRFALTLSNAENLSLGRWVFFAVPRDMPEQLASLLGGKAFVHTGLDDLRIALTKAGMPQGTLESPPPDARAAILGPWKSAPPRQLRERVRAMAERGVTCIVLGGDAAAMPRLQSQRFGKGAVITVSWVEFEDFGSNPAAQLALWEACRMAAAPDELPAWIKN